MKRDLSERYRATQRTHDAALAKPQTFPLTGDGNHARHHTVGRPKKGGIIATIRPSLLSETDAGKKIARARYLDWKNKGSETSQ